MNDIGPDVLDELTWRGSVEQSTDESALRAALAEGPITVYCGFDPTAPSLHFGNLVQLVVLRRFQRAGHRVICLVGGSTGLIGDPRPTSERVLRTKEHTAANVARLKELVRPFLDFDGDNPARLVDNLDWTAPMSAIDFLRDVGKHFRVNQMIRKEAIAQRLASQEGISYTEFSYQLLQALDYLELYRAHGCTLQTGGSDQWGNITAGVDLVHRAEGASVHALTTPLITDASGVKYGKSEGNAIWMSADMTSPYAFYQYFLNVEDASVVRLLKFFSDRGPDEIAELERQVLRRAVPPGGAAHAGRRRHHAGPRCGRDGGRAGRLGGAVRQGGPRDPGRAHPPRRDGRAPRCERRRPGPASSTRSSRWAWWTRARPPAGRSGRAVPR